MSTKTIWNTRYANNGNSGLGSHRKDLYNHKLNYIKNIIKKYELKSIFDYGCGDGNQVSEIIVGKDVEKYEGVDISDVIIEKNKIKYKDKSYHFLNEYNFEKNYQTFDLVLCLDVLYHILEEPEYIKTIDRLFNLTCKYVLIYAIDENSSANQHIHFRKFTHLIPKNFKLIETVDNPIKPFLTKFFLYKKI